MKHIVHFSQDFRIGKPQLGGFSRILNQFADGNQHVVFTAGKLDDFYELKINENLIFNSNFPLFIYKF